jgi:hypothetical protein
VKKTVALLVIILLAVPVILFLVAKPHPERPLSLVFVGFTNTLVRTEALFWFTNRARKDFTWDLTLELSRLTRTGWVHEAQVNPSVYTPQSASGTLPAFADLDLVGVPVTTTNDPIRVLLRCSQLAPARRRFQIWLVETRESLRAGRKVTYSHNQDFEVTGETVIPRQTGP